MDRLCGLLSQRDCIDTASQKLSGKLGMMEHCNPETIDLGWAEEFAYQQSDWQPGHVFIPPTITNMKDNYLGPSKQTHDHNKGPVRKQRTMKMFLSGLMKLLEDTQTQKFISLYFFPATALRACFRPVCRKLLCQRFLESSCGLCSQAWGKKRRGGTTDVVLVRFEPSLLAAAAAPPPPHLNHLKRTNLMKTKPVC